MKLIYKSVNAKGETVKGVIDARDPSEAAVYLRSKELTPITIIKKEKNRLNELPFFGGRVGGKDLVEFTRQTSSMLTSGLTLLRSLEILRGQVSNHALAEVIDGIIQDIQEGSTLSHALSKYPNIFSPVYISLIEASEGSGLLDKAFLRLADTLEKQQKLKSTVRSALTYPVIVVVMMILVAIVMMIFVIPQISTLYESLNVTLPFQTLLLIQISNFFAAFWIVPIFLVIISTYLFKKWHKTIEGRLIIDSLLLKIPIFGTLIKKTILVEFSRTLGALLASGTLVVDALNKVANITGNIHYTNAILDTAQRVEKGVSVGDAMSMHSQFPPNLIELVKIGEQTGKLDETLTRASEYFEREVDQSVKTISTLMEPAILIVLAVGVAFLVFSIITPIYEITNSIQ